MSCRYIVLEGPDGSGTTTHAALLAQRLTLAGRTVVSVAEPTGSGIGQMIRQLLREKTIPSAAAMQLLYCADRALHMEKVVRPALERGDTVLSDRSLLSTLAYGQAFGLDVSWLRQVNAPFVEADVTILLLPPLDLCLERLASQGKADAFEKREVQARVHAAYRDIAREDPRVHIVDSSASKVETAAQIDALIAR
jgi:dTMP kinase